VFTGIVEEVGSVTDVQPLGNGLRFTIDAPGVTGDLGLGDSIAVDGVCQTVTQVGDGSFQVQAVATTLGRTVMGDYRAGRRVNLERSVALGARLGGHLVQGHVDAVGVVQRIEPREELVLIECSLPPLVAEVTILHGSVAVNGVSLTVNALPRPDLLQLSIIPFTLDHTNFSDLRVGDRVNLEGDMIGKYVRHLLGAPGTRTAGEGPPTPDLLGAWGYSSAER
jgi:riboflavin synthase